MKDDFLQRLVGTWILTGAMGATQLRQKVEAQWVIQGHFLRVHCMQDGPEPQEEAPYEAVYMLGYDSQSGEYVMHLFDTFGAGYSRTVGVGKRRGDTVEFTFEYPQGLFSNTFTWDGDSGQWEMLLRQREPSGGWKTFATKSLVRVPLPHSGGRG
jgi:hypothetical protein